MKLLGPTLMVVKEAKVLPKELRGVDSVVAVVLAMVVPAVAVAIQEEEDLGVLDTVVVVDPTTPELIKKTHLVLMMVMA